MKPALAVFVKVFLFLAAVPSIWPRNPVRLPVRILYVPGPTYAARWN